MDTNRPEDQSASQPPPAAGVRMDWSALPEYIRLAIEGQLGSKIVSASSQLSGFSPGVAARLRLEDGRRFFVKAASPHPNPDSPRLHRREGQIAQALPPDAPVPRLVWLYDEGEAGWIVLVYENIDGWHPAQPWRTDELDRILDAMMNLSSSLTPAPIPPETAVSAGQAFRKIINGWQQIIDRQESYLNWLDSWSARHLAALARLEAQAPDAAAGDTLQHFDIRADNILLTAKRVWFVDWPHARVGAPWIDVLLFAPSVAMQGGPAPEQLITRYPACQAADPSAINAVVAAMAGFFTLGALQPPPPGLPTLRAFQAAQGVIAREWLAFRTGWD